MPKFSHMLAGAVTAVALLTDVAAAEDTVGVSWRYFQDERWKIDEAAMKSVLDKAGVSYVGIDAQGDPQKQAADIESLIARGVKVLVVVAQDAKAIIPVIDEAKRSNIAVIAYDAPIDTGDVLYTSFDNVAVGRVMGEGLLKAVPKGNYVSMDGDPAQTIQQVFKSGQMQAIQPAIDRGDKSREPLKTRSGRFRTSSATPSTSSRRSRNTSEQQIRCHKPPPSEAQSSCCRSSQTAPIATCSWRR